MTTLLQRLKSTAIKSTVAGVTVICFLEVSTNIPSQGRSSDMYMKISDELVTPLMRRFLNPEVAHDLVLLSLRYNMGPIASSVQNNHNVKLSISPFSKNKELIFSNVVGLAAGFDKNGDAISPLFDLGFGFVEIGTVTPKPQSGNPKPRMFRLKEDGAVINRYGFNSAGMDVVQNNLALFRGVGTAEAEDEEIMNVATKESKEVSKDGWGASAVAFTTIIIDRIWHNFPPQRRFQRSSIQSKVVGVNIGKNKITPEGEETMHDYQQALQKLSPYADYVVINLSSPNTPGLRNLQKSDSLEQLLQAVLVPASKNNNIPILIKIAPDLSIGDLQNISKLCMQYKVDGIIISNTTITRPSHLSSSKDNIQQNGGLSGMPLKSMSTQCIRTMYQCTGGSIPIIGVGGITNGQDAYEKLCAGASLIQVYTAMVYHGPGVVSSIQKELVDIMVTNGYRDVEDVIGLDHDDIYWNRKLQRMKWDRKDEPLILDDTSLQVKELENILKEF